MALWKPVKGYEELYLVSDEGEVVALPREVDNGRGVYIRKSQYLKPFPRGRDGIFTMLFVLLRPAWRNEHLSTDLWRRHLFLILTPVNVTW